MSESFESLSQPLVEWKENVQQKLRDRFLTKFSQDKILVSTGESKTKIRIENLNWNKVNEDTSGEVITFWLGEQIDWTQVIKSNRANGRNFFFQLNSQEKEFLETLGKVIENCNKETQERLHLNNLKSVNRELFLQTSKLETIVVQKSNQILTAKNRELTKISGIRSLLRFVKELSLVQSIEDLLDILRKEFKSFHSVRAPILAYDSPGKGSRIAFFQGKQVLFKEINVSIPNFFDLDPKSESAQKFLIEVMDRPMTFCLVVPISTSPDTPSFLFFEHQLDEEGQEEFMQSLAERINPIEVTLDRLQHQNESNRISVLWAKTFDDIDDPVAIIDGKFNVVRANSKFGTYENKKCYEIFANIARPCVNCPLNETGFSEKTKQPLVTVGKQIYEVRSFPIKFKNTGSAKNVIHHYVDVTTSKELESRVIQGEKMAAIGLLAGNIAHELNNPLTGIRSMAQILLKSEEMAENTSSDLTEVGRAAERCQKIIDNLLEFSKDSNELKGSVKIDPNEMIERTLPMLKTAMRFHNCALDLTEDPIEVEVDPNLLQHVIFNLVNNACQAMGESGNLSIQTIVADENVEIVVSDDGPGVPESIKSAIFDPFFTTKKQGEGTGLGLSMSQSIVNSFNGVLFLREDRAVGSEFVIQLPLSK